MNATASTRTIILVWELGGGIGHMMQMLPLARALVSSGHRVFVALRDVARGEDVFAGSGVCYLPAPYQRDPPLAQRPFPVTFTFAHILFNIGWGRDGALFSLASAWRNLFRAIRPDLIVFDHSPTALLASRGLPARRIVLGSGFCCPPNVSPWPLFRPEFERHVKTDHLHNIEGELLRRANRVLRSWGWSPLRQLSSLYSEVDETFLVTFRELDHYPDRAAARYWGPVLSSDAESQLNWPKGTGERIFGYLKPFPALRETLQYLRDSSHPTILHIEGVDLSLRQQFESDTLRITTNRLDMGAVRRECDVALLSGGHGATAEMLLSGKRVLEFPLALEQRLLSDAVVRLGAGAQAPVDDPEGVRAKLAEVLADSNGCRNAAELFAARYSTFTGADQLRDMARRVSELLS